MENPFYISDAIARNSYILLHLVSTVITGIAIFKIVSVTKRIEHCKVNNRIMLLHSVILLLKTSFLLIEPFLSYHTLFHFSNSGFESITEEPEDFHALYVYLDGII
jgi:hypothetical protein